MITSIIFMAAIASVYAVSGAQFIPQMLAIITAALLALAALAMLALRRRQQAKELALQALAFGGMALLVFSACKLDNSLARRGAVRLAAACADYKAKTGAYPDNFRKLAPDYIKSVPHARHTIMWAQYRLVDGKVMFVIEPGLLAHSYDIASGAWQVVDAAKMFPARS